MTRKPYYWLNDKSRTFLSNGYICEGDKTEQRIKEIAIAAEKRLEVKGFADKFEDYMSKGWYSLATPVWANFGKARGLPISCNGSYVEDSLSSILTKTAEVGMMSKYGAGTSVYLGKLRGRGATISDGGNSSGPAHFAELFDTVAEVVSQAGVRRGNCAAYLDVSHPDILEFLQIKGEGHPIQNLSIGVCVSDYWMQHMIQGDEEKRKIWAKIIQKRFESGYPYIFFTDTVNKHAPKTYKDKKMKIHASNLCSEICLSSCESSSFVCDLSSMNLVHYDEWKTSDAVETLAFFLDAVMSEYIEKAYGLHFFLPAVDFAVTQRALGIGVLGWHSALQEKMIPFESMEAKFLNIEIHKHIQEASNEATAKMATLFGEPAALEGYGRRNVTMMAIAPTTSSSFILGQVSPSIEPLNGNYFVKDLAKGKFTFKNPKLKPVLHAHGKDDAATWNSILKKGGSVQHLSFLSDLEKDVFKTFGEISQKEVIIQASQRQKFIDQSQSLNLMVHPKTSVKEVNQLMIEAWNLGIKTLYYQRSSNPAQELGRNLLDCKSCQA